MLIDSPGVFAFGAGGFARPTRAARILACRRWTDSSWKYRRGSALVTTT
jgi:hypothetical protein